MKDLSLNDKLFKTIWKLNNYIILLLKKVYTKNNEIPTWSAKFKAFAFSKMVLS